MTTAIDTAGVRRMCADAPTASRRPGHAAAVRSIATSPRGGTTATVHPLAGKPPSLWRAVNEWQGPCHHLFTLRYANAIARRVVANEKPPGGAVLSSEPRQRVCGDAHADI